MLYEVIYQLAVFALVAHSAHERGIHRHSLVTISITSKIIRYFSDQFFWQLLYLLRKSLNKFSLKL